MTTPVDRRSLGGAAGFRLFIGVDFSGARGPALPGLQVAACRPGRAAPRRVERPGGGHWTRPAFADWLVGRLRADAPVLCGLDFAFALPYEGGYLPGSGLRAGSARALWRLVDRICADSNGFYAGAFAARFGAWFLTSDHRGRRYARRMRRTDECCRDVGLGRPETPFKLVGPNQVGKAALAGMRLLHATATAHRDVTVWPFDRSRDGASRLVEIYPHAFAARAGIVGKVRGAATLNEVLKHYRRRPIAAGALDGAANLTDKTDALLSAAALRALGHDRSMWRPGGLTAEARRREGWIFGVP